MAATGFALSASHVAPAQAQAATDTSAWQIRNAVPKDTDRRSFVDMNVAPLKGQVTGKGCRVAVVEYFPNPENFSHANLVSALVNRRDVGIAPDANTTIFNLESTDYVSALIPYHVLNNSYALRGPYSGNNTALNQATLFGREGRFGLGALIFSSAGNEGQPYYETDKLLHNVMTIGSIGRYGNIDSISAPGPYVFAAAPGKMIYIDGGYKNGTSLAAPLASGVGCLMLEVNPRLGYRDAQDIIALTSRHRIVEGKKFARNAAKIRDGGGLHFRNGAGFGLIDAFAAVRLAETWPYQQIEETQRFYASGLQKGFDNTTRQSRLSVAQTDDMEIESVRIQFSSLRFPMRAPIKNERDVKLVLTSPAGTSVEIFTPADQQDVENLWISHGSSTPYFRGETMNGVWTLTLKAPGQSDVTMAGWTMSVRGKPVAADQQHVFTSDYRAGKKPAVVTNYRGGVDTINTAPIREPVTLVLDGSQSSMLGNQPLHISADAVETAITGDGNDLIITGKNGSTVMPGRGDDIVKQQGRNNTFIYRAGIDGDDLIVPQEDSDGVIVLKNIRNAAEITAQTQGTDLVLRMGTRRGSITLRNGVFTPATSKIILESTGDIIPVSAPPYAAQNSAVGARALPPAPRK